jgi:hypothetical protein
VPGTQKARSSSELKRSKAHSPLIKEWKISLFIGPQKLIRGSFYVRIGRCQEKDSDRVIRLHLAEDVPAIEVMGKTAEDLAGQQNRRENSAKLPAKPSGTIALQA